MQISSKYVGIILGILVFVVLTSGCIGDSDTFTDSDTFNDERANSDNNTPVKTYSGSGGVSFNYPGSWQRHTDKSDDPDYGTYIIHIDIDKNGSANNSPQFRVQIDASDDIEDYYHDNQELINMSRNVSHRSDGWHEVSNSTITVDGTTAYEYTMITDNKAAYGEIMREQEIRFLKNGNVYHLSFLAPDKDFDKEKPNFDLMLNSFRANTLVKTYSANGVSFNYPGSWHILTDKVDYSVGYSGDNIIYIDIKKNYSDNNSQFQVMIDSSDYVNYHDNQELLNKERNVNHGSDGFWHEISNSTITVDDTTAYTYTIITDDKTYHGAMRRMQEVCFFKNGNVYHLYFTAPNEDFDKEKPNFDLMVNSFKVQ